MSRDPTRPKADVEPFPKPFYPDVWVSRILILTLFSLASWMLGHVWPPLGAIGLAGLGAGAVGSLMLWARVECDRSR